MVVAVVVVVVVVVVVAVTVSVAVVVDVVVVAGSEWPLQRLPVQGARGDLGRRSWQARGRTPKAPRVRKRGARRQREASQRAEEARPPGRRQASQTAAQKKQKIS